MFLAFCVKNIGGGEGEQGGVRGRGGRRRGRGAREGRAGGVGGSAKLQTAITRHHYVRIQKQYNNDRRIVVHVCVYPLVLKYYIHLRNSLGINFTSHYINNLTLHYINYKTLSPKAIK